MNSFGTEVHSIENYTAVFTPTSRRKLNLFIPLRKMSNFLFSKMWHLPSLLKTILSQALSQHLYCLHCNDVMIWITSTGKTLSKAPKHSDLQSWIRVLSYLPKLFPSILVLSFSLSGRKLASFTAVTAELIVPHYPRDKATVTLS